MVSAVLSSHRPERPAASNQRRRRLGVRIALPLALVLAAAGQSMPAVAQGPVLQFYYRVEVIDPPFHFCVGEARDFLVRIRSSVMPGPNQPDEPANIPFPPKTSIMAEVTPGDILAITKGRTVLENGPDPDSYRPAIAVLTATGKKQGSASIIIGAVMPGRSAQPQSVGVQVDNCPIDVQAISRFTGKYPYGTIEFLAVTGQAHVTTNELKSTYKGTAPVIWIATSHIPGCVAADSLAKGTVNISGTVDERTGALHLTLQYDPVAFTEMIRCAPGVGGSATTVSATSPVVTVPMYGGVRRVSQEVTGEGQTIRGKVDVYVVPSELAPSN